MDDLYSSRARTRDPGRNKYSAFWSISHLACRAWALPRLWHSVTGPGGDDIPVRRDATPDQEEGRGLMLVESLGQDWGAYRAETGKVVWVAMQAASQP